MYGLKKSVLNLNRKYIVSVSNGTDEPKNFADRSLLPRRLHRNQSSSYVCRTEPLIPQPRNILANLKLTLLLLPEATSGRPPTPFVAEGRGTVHHITC